MEGKMVSLNPLKGGRFSLVRNIEEKILVVAKAISELSSEIEKSRNECWKDLRKGSDKEWKESSDKCQAKWDEVLDALGRAVVFSNSRVIDDWFEDLLFQESYRNQFERDPDEGDDGIPDLYSIGGEL